MMTIHDSIGQGSKDRADTSKSRGNFHTRYAQAEKFAKERGCDISKFNVRVSLIDGTKGPYDRHRNRTIAS